VTVSFLDFQLYWRCALSSDHSLWASKQMLTEFWYVNLYSCSQIATLGLLCASFLYFKVVLNYTSTTSAIDLPHPCFNLLGTWQQYHSVLNEDFVLGDGVLFPTGYFSYRTTRIDAALTVQLAHLLREVYILMI